MERTVKCRKLDMETYPRKAHFDYFCSLAYPYAGMTVNVDATELWTKAKATGESFFLHLLYAIGNAANAVPAFCRRIVQPVPRPADSNPRITRGRCCRFLFWCITHWRTGGRLRIFTRHCRHK